MPWTTTNNDHVYARVERLAERINAAREEARKLKELASEFAGDIEDLDSGDHTKAELVSFNTNVITPLIAFFENGVVAQRDRVADLQEWVHTS